MRVIAGQFKSIKLKALEGLRTRPTTDKVKENLFNIINVENKIVLDLFAGSGGLGIEAISRGADKCTFIDGSFSAIKIIKENIEKCKIDKINYEVYKNDYLRALKIFSKKQEKFDLIFLDPPYKKGLIDVALKHIIEYGLCNEDALIVCEKSSEENIIFKDEKLILEKEKKYGSIEILFYRYEE